MRIIGEGRSTVIQLKANANCNIIELKHSQVSHTEILNLTLDGASTQQTVVSHGIYYINEFHTQEFDSLHNIHNVFIQYTNGEGIAIRGRGSTSVSKVIIQKCKGYGMKVETWDTAYSDIEIGHCETGGIYLSNVGSANRFMLIKVYGCVNGWDINSADNSFTSCEAQDVKEFGFRVNNKNNSLYNCVVDTVGVASWNDTPLEGATSIILGTNATFCSINASCRDRKEYVLDGSQSYCVEILGNHCDINLMVRDIKISAIKNDNFVRNNKVMLSGAVRKNYEFIE